MKEPMPARVCLCLAAALVLSCPPGRAGEERVDLGTIHRIKREAIERSQALDHLFHLTDVHGPRITNSDSYLAAARWAAERLRSYGLAKAGLEPWGKFGPGWSFSRLSIQAKEPFEGPLDGVPLAWCGGTGGPVTGEVILAPFEEKEPETSPARLEEKVAAYRAKWAGRLRGKIVLLRGRREVKLPLKAAATRLEDADLASTARAPDPEPVRRRDLPVDSMPSDPAERRQLYANVPPETVIEYGDALRRARGKLYAALKEEGALAALTTDDRGDGGIIFAESTGLREPNPATGPVVVLRPEHHNRLARLAEKGIRIVLEVDLAVRLQEACLDGVNVVAEIPGGKKADEVVMLGAHLDSWQGGTGATDDAAGCAAVLEAARILKALDLPLDRTVRVALWAAEEQGLLGSRGYVRAHFGDPRTTGVTPEHVKLAAYFNLDNGAGKIRGIYLQGNDAARPVFEAWLAPFRDLGAATVSIRNTGGTDHVSFDAVGLPAFQFIQDPLDYMTRAHHSNLDTPERVPEADLVQASTILAAFAWLAATRDDPLPRKPLPAPAPPAKKGRTALVSAR